MSDNAEADNNLPFYLRLLLKIPKMSLESFSATFQNIFWTVLLPLMLMGYSFLNLILLILLPFPWNYASVIGVAFVLMLFMLRIFLDRELNTAKAMLKEGNFRWNVERAIEDYFQLLKKQNDNKNSEN